MKVEDSSIWLVEPTILDESYADRAEHTLAWLGRSTNQRARDCRRFLNENFAKVPATLQDSIRRKAPYRWKSVFFELIVARILQELGAEITIEEQNSEGRRPDFNARFQDETVIVEAVSPVFNSDAGELCKNHAPLLNTIEMNTPPGWSSGVLELPRIGPSESRREFESTVRQMLSRLPPIEGATAKEMCRKLSTGVVHLYLRPGSKISSRLLWEAPIACFDNSEERIRRAVKRKRLQVRSSSKPVLLAIEASGISSDFESFDTALFGRTFARYDSERQLADQDFYADGAFNTRSSSTPTYAGVLAFTNIGFREGRAPVLYIHPRFHRRLPTSLLELEHRIYDRADNRIRTVPATIVNLMQRLNFVSV